MDTFGPVSDNAQGIAEMSGDVTGEGAAVLTSLDAVGNTTKAITKGIAIATAVLAATALFGAFRESIVGAFIETGASIEDLGAQEVLQYFGVLNVGDPSNLVGLLIGAAVVFLFSGLAINAVSRAAGAVIYEVRRQFREHPGIMDGTERPEYGKVVDIVTRDSLRELATPGLLAVLTPIAVGFGLGVGALGSFLAGTIATGTLMAVFLANSGGAWDNAKKFVEDGNFGGKGSPAHEATVIGDTVGDPFKDTAGPAINPLLKVMNLVALLIAPAVVQLSVGDDASTWLRVDHCDRFSGDRRRGGRSQQATEHRCGGRVAAGTDAVTGSPSRARARAKAGGSWLLRHRASSPISDRPRPRHSRAMPLCRYVVHSTEIGPLSPRRSGCSSWRRQYLWGASPRSSAGANGWDC